MPPKTFQPQGAFVLATLAALDRKINSFRDVAAHSVDISSRRQAVEIYLLLIGNGYQIAVCIKQFKINLLIALILIYLSVKQRAS